MTMVSLILGSIVFVYTMLYSFKKIFSICNYLSCKKSDEIKIVEGHIVEKIDEENKVYRGLIINICFPKFEYTIGNKKEYYQSTVRYKDAQIGQIEKIGVSERTGEAWVIKDIPIMKKDLLVKVTTIFMLLIMLILTEIML